ncbi:MAG TPA: DoxX family protein [Conexibacter sp.]|jgi:putative oxidoreductase
MKIGLLVVRLLIGGLLVGHGTQKLFGWFGGEGPGPTGEAFEGMGLRPGRRNAIAAGAAEAGGGTLLAAGLMTPVGAAAVTGSLATAIAAVHAKAGPWVTRGGWEYSGVLVATLFTIVDVGPGHWSLDSLYGRSRWGTPWALGAVAVGAAGAGLAIALGRSYPTPDEDAANEMPAADASAG